MVILTVEDLSKSFGVDPLFKDVNFGVQNTDKIGIIGANGAGKSTLLKILSGRLPPDSGRIAINREVRIEYLSQAPELNPELAAFDQVLLDGPKAFEVVQRYEAALVHLEANPHDEAAMERVSELGAEMDREGGWTIEAEAKGTLGNLGIHDQRQLIGTMSGGQRKRVALARALIRPAELLILDEPTNHLDVDTVAWLEGHLASRQGALMLVTHDRYFLDRVTQVILEIDRGTTYRHEGNYSAFLEHRAMREEIAQKREAKRVQLAKKELEWLRRGPKARTSKAKSRIDRAHELMNTSYDDGPRDDVSIDMLSSRLGKKILELDRITKAFGEHVVVRDFSYTVPRGDRVGIIGPNGAGKSTLLDMITGRLQPDSGTIEVGETVVFGYYDQESEELDETKRVHDYITQYSNAIQTSEGSLSASKMLERFLFSPARQWSPIAKLSGGERRRLYLLRILMEQPNVLILDEPTNDLDVETLTVLEEFLDEYDGILIVVSHDRYFLDRTVEHLFVFQDDHRLVEFPGNFTAWSKARDAKRAEEAARARAEAAKPAHTPTISKTTSTPKKLGYKEQRELEALEAEIPTLEEKLEALDADMLTHASDFEKLGALQAEREDVERGLEAAMERWMELEERAQG
ncbi:MAG: ABC-F family ATP-binding cassette domain-containing protein [Myxococcota bacterium]